MSDTDMKATVFRVFALIGENKWDEVEALLTDDFVAHEAPLTPYAGVYQGPKALRKMVESIFGSLTFTSNELLDVAVGSDHVVTVQEIKIQGWDGDPVRVAETYKFRDGKICEIRPHYFDPLPLIAAVQNTRPAYTA